MPVYDVLGVNLLFVRSCSCSGIVASHGQPPNLTSLTCFPAPPMYHVCGAVLSQIALNMHDTCMTEAIMCNVWLGLIVDLFHVARETCFAKERSGVWDRPLWYGLWRSCWKAPIYWITFAWFVIFISNVCQASCTQLQHTGWFRAWILQTFDLLWPCDLTYTFLSEDSFVCMLGFEAKLPFHVGSRLPQLVDCQPWHYNA